MWLPPQVPELAGFWLLSLLLQFPLILFQLFNESILVQPLERGVHIVLSLFILTEVIGYLLFSFVLSLSVLKAIPSLCFLTETLLWYLLHNIVMIIMLSKSIVWFLPLCRLSQDLWPFEKWSITQKAISTFSSLLESRSSKHDWAIFINEVSFSLLPNCSWKMPLNRHVEMVVMVMLELNRMASTVIHKHKSEIYPLVNIHIRKSEIYPLVNIQGASKYQSFLLLYFNVE